MRFNITKELRKALAVIVVGGCLALFGGCAGEVYGPGVAASYDYDYYPDRDVYFYPAGHLYYWNEGGHWRSGGALPHDYELHEEQRQHLQLHTRKPWTEHQRDHH